MMFVDDYTPMKRIGIEELEGCVRIFERRIEDYQENTERKEGAWLALHMMLTGRYRYPDDFVAVWEQRCDELFGGSDAG